MSSYSKIINIRSLNDILLYLQRLGNTKNVCVWLDWDENIINSSTNEIIEPEVTRKLFDYMISNEIFFSIITGRFHDTVCNDNTRVLKDMEYNIVYTIFPVLKKLGVYADKFVTPESKKHIYKIGTSRGKCVGVLYMGIIFSGNKGQTIKNYLRQTKIKSTHNIFVDDYEPYLTEATKSFPEMTVFRRYVPYLDDPIEYESN